MFDLKSAAGGLVVGLVLGAGAGFALFGSGAVATESADVPTPQASSKIPVRPGRPDPVPAAAPVSVSQEEVDRLTLENTLLRGQLTMLGGAPTDWPEHVDSRYGAEHLDPWIQDAVSQIEGVELEDLDCSEFPCIALLRYDPSLSTSTEHVLPITEQFAADVEGSGVQVSLVQREAGAAITLAFVPSDDTPALETRIGMRKDEMLGRSDDR